MIACKQTLLHMLPESRLKDQNDLTCDIFSYKSASSVNLKYALAFRSNSLLYSFWIRIKKFPRMPAERYIMLISMHICLLFVLVKSDANQCGQVA